MLKWNVKERQIIGPRPCCICFRLWLFKVATFPARRGNIFQCPFRAEVTLHMAVNPIVIIIVFFFLSRLYLLIIVEN